MNSILSGLEKNERLSLLVIFLTAFLIRLVFVIYADSSGVSEGFVDDLAYMKKAEILLEEGLFNWQNEKINMIGLPFVMALTMGIFGKHWMALFILNSFVGAFTSVLIYKTGKLVFSWKVGFAAGLWSSIYILFLKYTATSGKEPWMVLFFMLILYLAAAFLKAGETEKKKKIKLTVLTGIIYTIFIHFDERYFSYIPLILLLLIFASGSSVKEKLRYTVIFGIIFLALMAPWLIRNYQVHDKIVILSDRTAHLTDKIFGYKKKNYTLGNVENMWHLSPAQVDSVINGEKFETAGGIPIDAKQIEAMKRGNIPEKFSRLERYFSTFVVFWKPIDFYEGYSTYGYRFDGRWSVKHNLSVGLTYGPVLLLSIFALIILFRKKHYFAYFALAIFGWHTIIHVLFIPFARNRYRIPVDGLIIILGMYGLFYLIDYLRRERKAALKA